ncbi:MAG: FAD-binding oxidoreductase [Paracoccaceae bacterium]
MSKTAIVIGAGITGLSSAIWLQRRGWQVELLDRIAPGDPEQASYGNAGLLARGSILPNSEPGMLFKVPGMLVDSDSPLFLRWRYLPRLLPWFMRFIRAGGKANFNATIAPLDALVSDTIEQHMALAEGGPAARHIRLGEYSYLYPDRAAYEAGAVGTAIKKQYGLKSYTLQGAALAEHTPGLGARYGFMSVYPDYGWITDPGQYMRDLAEDFCAKGGTLRLATVMAITPGTPASVSLADGSTLTAARVVLCAGAHSQKLLSRHGPRLWLEAERGYHLFLRNPSFMPPNPIMVDDAKCVITPMEHGLRIAGIAEYATLDAPRSTAPLALLAKRIGQVFPDLQYESADEWMGQRPSTPDGLPYLGEDAQLPGIISAFGSQHIGLTIGPRLGRMVADIAEGARPNRDATPYRLNRHR